jgi:hypothetical protein
LTVPCAWCKKPYVATVTSRGVRSRGHNACFRRAQREATQATTPEAISRIHSLQRRIEDHENRKKEFFRAVRQAALDAITDLRIDPPRAIPVEANSSGDAEIAIVHASDWQLGKRTPSYDSKICEKRIRTFAQKIGRITKIMQADHPVREARLYLTGDMVEGEGIFPSQAHQIDSGLFRQVAVNGPRILVGLILDMLQVFEKIHVVGVIGNHGVVKLSKVVADPETNMDRVLYEITRHILCGTDRAPNAEIRKRVTWDIPSGIGERNWYAVDRIGKWGHLLIHGDQIRGGFAGFPFYGASKKAMGWIDGISDPWDSLFAGHFHTPTRLTINRRRAYFNGSPESGNDYALEQLGAVGHPTQFLGFCHPRIGMTSEYWVDLEPRIPRSVAYASR